MDGANLTNIPSALSEYYDRVLLEREKPYLVYTNFGQVRNIPAGNGRIIKFRKYGALTVITDPLEEMVTKTPSNPVVTDITATVNWYGDWMPYSDVVTIESPDPVLTELTQVLGDQAGASIDTICRNVLVQGTNVLYADATSPKANDERTDITTGDVMDKTILDLARATLRGANAKFITNYVSPDMGYNSASLLPCFIVVVHPNVVPSLMAITGFKTPDQYYNKGNVMPNEVGSYGNFRFVESTQAPIYEGAGASASIDVYASLVFAMDAYGTTEIKGHGMEMIIKALGSSGSADPHNQRGSIAWKASHVTKILNHSWMLRIEHTI